MIDFDTTTFVSPNVYLDYVAGFFQNGESKIYIRHINFCPNIPVVSCTVENAKSAAIQDKFVKLINHLKQLATV